MGLGGWIKVWWVEMEKIAKPGRENYMRKARKEFKKQRTLCGQAWLNKYLLNE